MSEQDASYSRRWTCLDCKHECSWTYDNLAERGSPVCPDCDANMVLVSGDKPPQVSYSVVGYYFDNSQPFVFWIDGADAEDALRNLAADKALDAEEIPGSDPDNLVVIGVFQGSVYDVLATDFGTHLSNWLPKESK